MEWIAAIYQSIISFFEGWADFVLEIWTVAYRLFTEPTEVLNTLWLFAVQFIYWFINEIINQLGTFITWLSTLMPAVLVDNLPTANGVPVRILDAMNWVLPFDHLSICISILIVSTMAWASIGIVFRWLKIFA